MCGLAGILDRARDGDGAQPQRAELAAMISRLQHRGPDGYGFFSDGAIGLAHARLSIIDIAGGNQPVFNEDKTVCTVFNGEIFNYIELRRELEARGHRFYTHSDTETIVHLYEEYGHAFVHRLNGQFAIALWDKTARRLVLARDRAGIRPLFYTEAGGRLAFASEAKALFALPEVERRLDVQGLGQLFTYWAPLAPTTVFANVHALPPGHTLVVDDKGLRIARYWDWQFPDRDAVDTRSPAECLDGLREQLVQSVRLQVRADVPVGAYLSGGLDSSLIVALLKRYTDVPLRTFSLRFRDREFDEGQYQQQVVAHVGTEHSEVECDAEAICAAFPRAIWHTESPVLRTAAAPLMLLSAQVRAAGYKVVLTGEGADEVMAGYDIYKEGQIRRFWARDPGSKMRPRLFSRLYPYLPNSPTASPAYAQRFFGQGLEAAHLPYFAHLPRWQTTQRVWQFFSADMRAELAGFDPGRTLGALLPPTIGRWAGLSRDQYVEAHTLLSGYLLSSQGDRMAMANSVEGRFPFLDHNVIEYCNALPPRYKLMGLNEKYLLKQLARELLPAGVLARSKQPYRAPDIASFFRAGEPADYVAELLSDARVRASGYFDPTAVARLLKKCRSGRAIGFADNMAFVGVVSTLLLHDMFVRQAPGRGAQDNPHAFAAMLPPRHAARA